MELPRSEVISGTTQLSCSKRAQSPVCQPAPSKPPIRVVFLQRLLGFLTNQVHFLTVSFRSTVLVRRVRTFQCLVGNWNQTMTNGFKSHRPTLMGVLGGRSGWRCIWGISRLRVRAGFIPSFEWQRNFLLDQSDTLGWSQFWPSVCIYLAKCTLFMSCVCLVRVPRCFVLVLVHLVAVVCHSPAVSQPVLLSLNSLVWLARSRNPLF